MIDTSAGARIAREGRCAIVRERVSVFAVVQSARGPAGTRRGPGQRRCRMRQGSAAVGGADLKRNGPRMVSDACLASVQQDARGRSPRTTEVEAKEPARLPV